MSGSLVAKSRAWCVGRLVFDRPVASEIFNQKYRVRDEVIKTEVNVSESTFKEKINDREKELREKQRVDPSRRNAKTGHIWLEKAFSPTHGSRAFVYREYDVAGRQPYYNTESYSFFDGKLISTSNSVGAGFLAKSEAYYDDLLRRIKPRDNWNVPTESGFCIDGAIVTGGSDYTEDASQSIMLLPGRPASFVVKMRDSVSEDQQHPLSKDLPDLRSRLNNMPGHYRILRQGTRQIAGMNAEEVLFELSDGKVTAYRFYLLAAGDPSTLTKPHLTLELLLGAPSSDTLPPEQATSPVDEAGALQTWDTLLNSFRPRPGAL